MAQIFGKCVFSRYIWQIPLPHKFMDKFYISVLFARFSCTNCDIKWGKCVLDLDFNWNHCELILYLTFTFGTHVSWYYTYLTFGANVIWYYTQHLHLEPMWTDTIFNIYIQMFETNVNWYIRFIFGTYAMAYDLKYL